MNWPETIEYIRNESSYSNTVSEAYLSENLNVNVDSFRKSIEFAQTLKLLDFLNIPRSSRLLDVGAGNGISSIAFALEGFDVTALEPEVSDTVGSGAIIKLKKAYDLKDMVIVSTFGEEMPFDNDSFDIVYARQCMHHAYDLERFTKSIHRVVKPNGILLTVRDHVISDEADKKAFLSRHPLHKFYGGENAFKLSEYKNAITDAGFTIKQILAPADSAINYSPWSIERVKEVLRQKVGRWAVNPLSVSLCWWVIKYRLNRLPGRLYSFVAKK